MNFETMKEALHTIDLMEKDLMRDLSDKEKDVVVEKGWKEFLFSDEYLGLTEEDFKEMKEVRSLIGAYYTSSEEEYKALVKHCPTDVYFALKNIVNDIEEADNKTIRKEDSGLDKECPCDTSRKSFDEFLDDLSKSIPEMDTKWFDHVTKEIRDTAYRFYKSERKRNSDLELGSLMIDLIKDEVVLDLVKRLKKGEVIKMTDDQYDEVVEQLFMYEDHVHITNHNGMVKLK